MSRLHKAIYGLKQAPRAWFSQLSSKLGTLGFTKSRADTFLLIFRRGAVIILVLVYVDDILVIGSSPKRITGFIDALGADFDIKSLGDLKYFLDVEAFCILMRFI